MFDLDIGYLDAPFIGLLIKYLLHIRIEPIPLRQHFIELVLTQHRSKCRLGKLTCSLHKILHLDCGAFGIDNPKIDHGVHLDRNIVARDHILLRHAVNDCPEIHPNHLLN